jgi:hypothetical protein
MKILNTVHITMVGNGNGRHLKFTGSLHQVFKPDGSVQEAVHGAKVEMNKR